MAAAWPPPSTHSRCLQTRIKNDRELHEREVGRKREEAERAKRAVGHVAAQHRLAEGDEAATTALRHRLQGERRAMADSIRKKLGRAQQTRQQAAQRARQEARQEALPMPVSPAHFSLISPTRCRSAWAACRPSSAAATTRAPSPAAWRRAPASRRDRSEQGILFRLCCGFRVGINVE